jgi:glycosyltransferase involved in cell wall biosynthesis
MTPLKIACVTPALPFDSAHFGGAETYAEKLSHALANLGCQITILSGTESSDENLPKNLRIRKLKMINKPIFIFGRGRHFSSNLLSELLETDVDIIHVHHLRSPLHVTSFIASKVKRVPIVLTDHGGGGLNFPQLLAQFPTAFATVSKYSATNLLRYAPQKRAFVLYAGVDTKQYNQNVRSEDLRRRLRVDDAKIILFVGRIMPHKGIDILIRAIPFVAKMLAYDKIKVFIVGPKRDSNYYYHLRVLTKKLGLSNDVFFFDAVSQDELPKFYSMCEVFVLPSVQVDCFGRHHSHPELLSLASLEAMACGKPAIASCIGGVPEIVRNGETGILVEPGNVSKLAEALYTVLKDEELKQQMSSKALSFVQKLYTWEAVARRAILAYDTIINDS